MTKTGKTSCPLLGFEKILLASDGSEYAQAAIREAINIAKTCGSKLFAVSVVEVNPEYEALAPKLVDKAENETRDHLASIKAMAAKEGLSCQTIAHQGEEPYRFIVDEAARNKVDMIVMGSHGRTGIKRLLMGSVTARVIGHAPCKVLVVPC
ncbi:MAG: universal stress protein [Nitrospiraceae bacterium]|nr:universal stress protein [Nitrospiraceae bacterium]